MSESQRAVIFRWLGWFGLANAFVLAIVGTRYLQGFTPGGTTLSWIYLGLVYPAHHVMLAVVPLFLLLTPVILLRPSMTLARNLGVVIFALLIAGITLDSLLWSQSRFHLNGLTVQILGWQSWMFVAVIFAIAVFFEFMLANWTKSWVDAKANRKGRLIAVLAVICLFGSQLIHAWADAAYYVPVTSVGQQLPVYKGFTAKRQLVRLGLVDPDASREREIARRLSRELDQADSGTLSYPRKPLQCVNEEPLNLLVILADALRWDMLQSRTMPFVTQEVLSGAQSFEHHFSGGNSSRMGVFSLFYGLPPGYWSSFESMQKPAVLISQLQDKQYQLGLFSSSTLYRPVALDRTAFATVPDLRLQSEPADAPSWERDKIALDDWTAWMDSLDKGKPFFGFLFFDATNSQQYPPGAGLESEYTSQDSTEAGVRFANYQRSARYVDSLIQSVFDSLERLGMKDNTVIVITSDHGEEFGESSARLMGHGSGYTDYQLRVPMAVFWPGKSARSYQHRTSHYDVVPTLMQDVLGCTNELADYAIGKNLFEEKSWDWLLVGSYYNYAVLEPDQITITYPNGQYEIRDRNYSVIDKPQVRGDILMAVTLENSRFHR